jgi:hypothetical protein
MILNPRETVPVQAGCKSANAHTIDVNRDLVNLNIDLGQMGVGVMIHGVQVHPVPSSGKNMSILSE